LLKVYIEAREGRDSRVVLKQRILYPVEKQMPAGRIDYCARVALLAVPQLWTVEKATLATRFIICKAILVTKVVN
jgi:hypothetical protein